MVTMSHLNRDFQWAIRDKHGRGSHQQVFILQLLLAVIYVKDIDMYFIDIWAIPEKMIPQGEQN